MSHPTNNLDPRSNNNPNIKDVGISFDNSTQFGASYPPPNQIPQLTPYTQPYTQPSPYSNANLSTTMSFPSISSQTQGSLPIQTTNYNPTQLQVDPNTLLALLSQINTNALKLQQPQTPGFVQNNTSSNLTYPPPKQPLVNQMALQSYPHYPNDVKYDQNINYDYREKDNNHRNKRRSDAIIVCNLPHDITVEVLANEFEKYGKLKYDRSKNPPQPLIIIYYDGTSPKGEAKIIFEDPNVAESAVKHYHGQNTFGNGPLNVRLAGPPVRDREWRDRGRDKGYRKDEKFKGFSGKGGAPREGDWICPDCANNNFSWREFCHQCGRKKTPDVETIKGEHLSMYKGNNYRHVDDKRYQRRSPY